MSASCAEVTDLEKSGATLLERDRIRGSTRAEQPRCPDSETSSRPSGLPRYDQYPDLDLRLDRYGISLSRASMKGVILAGGSGKRLAPLTDITNKHLLPLYDRPMAAYAVEALVEA